MTTAKAIPLSQLDQYLPEKIRSTIEERYLARINEQALMEQVILDPNFYQDPEQYPPFYADHGVIHHRDVALQILRLMETTPGLLIPAREQKRLEFMKGYGVLITFLHDLGMADFSAFGRVMHPEVATQSILGPAFEDILHAIWEQNSGNLAWRLSRLSDSGALEQRPMRVLCEMLAMVNCHSKSKVPVRLLNDPEELRRSMQKQAGTPLDILYQEHQMMNLRQSIQNAQAQQDQAAMDSYARQLYELDEELQTTRFIKVPEDDPSTMARRQYDDFEIEAFSWLTSTCQETRNLVKDVIDTLRILRCADALRQRGDVLKTSGGYEVFIDQNTANAILALRLGREELFLLEISDTLSAGEANIASSQIDQDGNLRISFHRGAFRDAIITRRAAYNAAVVVNDIQADAIESFFGVSPSQENEVGAIKSVKDMKILLEGVPDNLEFADNVIRELALINPQAAACAQSVPSLQDASPLEIDRYLQAPNLEWDLATRQEALERISRSGHNAAKLDLEQAFKDIKLIRLKAGDVLVEAGASSSFVYIPMGEGLRILPLGGYASFPVNPWMPLGITGVIRGATRNATITSERDLMLLMIPKEAYLKEWHHTYSVAQLTQLLEQRVARLREQEQTTLSQLERAIVLQTIPFFAEVPEETLNHLANIVHEIRFNAEEDIFKKGDVGNSMYIIVGGRVRVHSDEQTLNNLGKGDVFGEMALLDPEPRMASVTAVEDTQLLRLEREAFLSLMARHVEVAQGVIRVLLRRLRARGQDVAELRARLSQLDPTQNQMDEPRE